MYDIKIGPRLKACRKGKKLTQDKLSELIGITVEHQRALESGRESPSVETLYRIADRLGVIPSVLLTDDPPQYPTFPYDFGAVSPKATTQLAQMLQIILGEKVDEAGFGDCIRQRRTALGKPVKQFAKKFGVSGNQVYHIERGASYPSFAVFVAMLNELRLCPEMFFRNEYDLCALAILSEVYERCTKQLLPKKLNYASTVIYKMIESES